MHTWLCIRKKIYSLYPQLWPTTLLCDGKWWWYYPPLFCHMVHLSFHKSSGAAFKVSATFICLRTFLTFSSPFSNPRVGYSAIWQSEAASPGSRWWADSISHSPLLEGRAIGATRLSWLPARPPGSFQMSWRTLVWCQCWSSDSTADRAKIRMWNGGWGGYLAHCLRWQNILAQPYSPSLFPQLLGIFCWDSISEKAPNTFLTMLSSHWKPKAS